MCPEEGQPMAGEGGGELESEGNSRGQSFLSYKTVKLNEVYVVTNEEVGRGEFGVV